MNNYYLRGISKLQVESALKDAGLLVEQDFGNGKVFFIPIRDVDICHIGSIVIEDPEIDENGILTKDTVFDNYWHTNIRTKEELTEEQKQILPLVYPKTPKILIG